MRERERVDPLERTGDGESRMKNAITILKNGPSLPRERTSTPRTTGFRTASRVPRLDRLSIVITM